MLTSGSHPALRGGLLALLAAVLFGGSTPLVQRFGTGAGAFGTAALLYAGAAAVACCRAGASSARRVPRAAPTCGAWSRWRSSARWSGPVALAWGLQRTKRHERLADADLEALFTAVLAWRLYRRRWIAGCGRRCCCCWRRRRAGGRPGSQWWAQLLGLLAVLLPLVAWGVDNTLSRALAERDPARSYSRRRLSGAERNGPPRSRLRRTPAAAPCGACPVCRRRHRIWDQPALLPAGPARVRPPQQPARIFAFAPFIGAVAAIALSAIAPCPG